MSAALGDDLGGMQSQETLLTRTGAPGGAVEPHWWDDFGRAKRLCEWAKRRGDQIEGFVRMNAGFELLWCDFESEALRHLGHLNITPPGTPMVPEGANPRPPRGNRPPPPPEAWGTRPRHLPPHPHPHAPPPRHGNRTDRPRGPPTGPRKGPNGSPEPPPRWFAPRSQLSSRNAFEWLRTAEARYRSPQPHLDIDAHFAASLYDPRWTSLVSARNESEGTHKGKHNSNSTSGNMQRHRVWEHISDKDASGWAEMVEKNVEKWYKQLGGLARPTWTWPPGRTHHHPGPGYAARDRIDWPRKARYVMEHWGHRLGALRNMLVSETNASGAEQPENHRPDANGSSKISYTRLAEDVNLLTYSMLSPWLQGPDVPYDQPNGLNPSDSDAQAEGSWKTQTLKRCIRAHTVGTRYAHRGDTQVAHERFLELGAAAAEGTHQAALEGVLERLCADVLDTFARSLEARSNWVALQNVELEPTPAVGGHAHVAGDQKHDHVVEVRAWREKIEELMRWLDWTVWDRCPRQCGWDVSLCIFPFALTLLLPWKKQTLNSNGH